MADFWFNRMVEHWVVPLRLDLPDQWAAAASGW